jgi:hypothetical protein
MKYNVIININNHDPFLNCSQRKCCAFLVYQNMQCVPPVPPFPNKKTQHLMVRLGIPFSARQATYGGSGRTSRQPEQLKQAGHSISDGMGTRTPPLARTRISPCTSNSPHLSAHADFICNLLPLS